MCGYFFKFLQTTSVGMHVITFAERHMLSRQQQQQQTVVMDAGPLATDDAGDPTCNHRVPPPPRPIITRTVATPVPTPRGSPAAAAVGDDDVICDVIERDASTDSFVTSLAGYSDTLSYEVSFLLCSSFDTHTQLFCGNFQNNLFRVYSEEKTGVFFSVNHEVTLSKFMYHMLCNRYVSVAKTIEIN